MRTPIGCFAFLLFLSSWLTLAAQTPEIAVVKEDSPLRFSGKTVGQAKRDAIVKVREVRGSWAEIGTNAQQEWIRLDRLHSPEAALESVKKRRAEDRSHRDLQAAEAALVVRVTQPERLTAELNRRIQAEPKNPFLRYELGRAEFLRNFDDHGLSELNEAIRLDDSIGEFYAQRARVLQFKGQSEAAHADYLAAEKRGGADAITYNNLAWRLATHTDQKQRDGKQAIVYALKACEMTGYTDESHIDTLAAAYAEDGQYNEAIKWQEKAISLGVKRGDPLSYEERLKLYRDGKPYREYDP